ncbi:hypothetical protein Tco_0005218 [Tanacetum coccineum]
MVAKPTLNDNSNSRTLNVNVVCAECGKCVFNSNHDACVSKYLNDVNARTKKPKVVPISASKPKRKTNKSVATPHKKTVASDTTIQKPKSYFKELYENTNKAWKCARMVSQKMSYIKWCLLKITLQAPFLNVQMTSVHISSGLVLHQMTSDHNRSELGIHDHNNEQSSSKLVPKVVP